LPEPPKDRKRRGEDLLPFGDYADIEPQQQLCEDAELVQYQETQDPAFYQSEDWWWDDQRIRFLKSQIGISILLMAVPVVWFMAQLGVVLYLTVTIPPLFFKGSMVGAILTLLILTVGFFLL
jgi:hypothetical protein